MPLVSAQSYVASLLTGMLPPGKTAVKGPITALITPLDPDVNPDGTARCYVWPATGPEKRRAMPRNSGPGTPAGWKDLLHELSIFLMWTDSQQDPGKDVNFPLFIDWVMDILRTSPNAAQWQDPETGVISNFANLGEVMSYDYVPPRTLETQRRLRYDARVRCSLLELFQR
jgi:hypothetical protein